MNYLKRIFFYSILLVVGTVTSQVKFESKPDIEELNDKVFIITEIDNTKFKLSDSILVKYRLFVSLDTGIENWRETLKPNYKDFDAKDVDLKGYRIIKENYKGANYRTVTLKEVLLKPNKTGAIKLPEYALNIKISIPSRNDIEANDSRNQRLLTNNQVLIKTKEINLTVI